MTPYQKHKQKWGNCTRCDLHKKRKKVVLVGGKLPAPILFIGEAPGASEDVSGRPFCGPAGKVLHHIIERAVDGQWDYAITNLVACILKDGSGAKIHEPPRECIETCRSRLQELILLCNPSLVVDLGRLALNFALPLFPQRISQIALTHPAAILRLDITQKSLAVGRCIVTLSDAVDELE